MLRDIDRLGKVVSRYVELPPQCSLFVVFGKRQAVDGADIDAGVAFDALLCGEHGFDIAVKTTLCLLQGCLGVETKLHFQGVAVDGFVKVDVRHCMALLLGDHAGIAPFVDAHFLADQVGAWPGPVLQIMSLKKHIDGERGLVSLRHGGNDVLRAECGVAAEEYSGEGGLKGFVVDYRKAGFVELDADITLDPGKGVGLANGQQDQRAVDRFLPPDRSEHFGAVRLDSVFNHVELHGLELAVFDDVFHRVMIFKNGNPFSLGFLDFPRGSDHGIDRCAEHDLHIFRTETQGGAAAIHRRVTAP